MNVKLKTLRHFNRGGVTYARGVVYQVDDATAETLHATGHFDRWSDQEAAKPAPAKAEEPKKEPVKEPAKEPAKPVEPAKPEEQPVKV